MLLSIRDAVTNPWLYFNAVVKWDDHHFDWHKAAACATFSKLAYLAIPDFEFEERGRFKLIPCNAYYEVIASGQTLVSAATLADLDLARSFVIISRLTVVVGVRMSNVVILAVRGTSTLYKSSALYDWRVNFTASKQSLPDGASLHRGFMTAAIENIERIYDEMEKIIGGDEVDVYITGHSLGGAVAAVLLNFMSGYFSNSRSEWPECPRCGFASRYPSWHRQIGRVNSAYTFGMPRYGNVGAIAFGRSPYHILHEKDLVPKVPLPSLGYVDCGFNLANGVEDYKKPNHGSLLSRMRGMIPFIGTYDKVMWYHNMENYLSGTQSHAQ